MFLDISHNILLFHIGREGLSHSTVLGPYRTTTIYLERSSMQVVGLFYVNVATLPTSSMTMKTSR